MMQVKDNLIINDKFKKITYNFKIIDDFTINKLYFYQIFSILLKEFSNNFDTKEKMILEKDRLFDIGVQYYQKLRSDKIISTIRIDFLNPKYTNLKINDYHNFIEEILNNPIVNIDKFEYAKSKILDVIRRKSEKPLNIAIKNAFEKIDDKYGLKKYNYGIYENIINFKYNDYLMELDLFLNKEKKLMIYGDVDGENPYYQKYVFSNDYNFNFKNIDVVKIQDIKESSQFDQSITLSFFKSNILFDSDYYLKFYVAINLLAFDHNSLMFLEAREKENLCYSVSNILLENEGIFIIYSSISNNCYEKYKEVLNKQITRIKNKKYPKIILERIKKSLIQSIILEEDKQYLSLERKFNEEFFKRNKETIINSINTVTKDDISKIFMEVNNFFNYFLSGDGYECNK